MEQNTESSLNLFELQLDNEATNYLGDTARWSKFFAIVGFIGCGSMAILPFISGAFTSSVESGGTITTTSFASSGLTIGIDILVAILYFFPALYLFRFSVKMQGALRNNDQPLLNQSFRNLKACFKFIGILTIILMGLAILGIVLAIINLASR